MLEPSKIVQHRPFHGMKVDVKIRSYSREEGGQHGECLLASEQVCTTAAARPPGIPV